MAKICKKGILLWEETNKWQWNIQSTVCTHISEGNISYIKVLSFKRSSWWSGESYYKLDQEADTTLNQRPAEPCVVSWVSTECETDILKGKVSIRAPEVIKGPKKKREDVLEKKGEKKKTTNKKR